MPRQVMVVVVATLIGPIQAWAAPAEPRGVKSPPQRDLVIEATAGGGAIVSFDPVDKTPVFSFGFGVGDFVSRHVAISARAAGFAATFGAAVVVGPHVELWLDEQNWIGVNPGLAFVSFHSVGADGTRSGTLSDGLDVRGGHVFSDHGGFSVGAELLQIGAFTSLRTGYAVSVELGLERF